MVRIVADSMVLIAFCYLYDKVLFSKYDSFSRRSDLKMEDRIENIEKWLQRLSEVAIATLVFIVCLR